MASQEVIDLTEPEVIELDTDGDEVNGGQSAASTQTPQENAGQQPGKKKRKKKRRKAGAQGNQDEQVGSTLTSAEVSRPESPHSQDEPEIVEVVRDKEVGKSGSDKRSLQDRLSGNAQVVPEGEGRRRRDQKGKEKERRRDEERDRERERDRKRDRDRRRSRSPRRERDRDRDREPRRRSRSRDYDRDRERRTRDKDPERDPPLFFEDVTPAEVPAGAKLPSAVAGPSRLPAQTNGQVDNGLLLPAHVSVAEGAEAEALELGPLKVPTPEPDSDEEDYIDYLDYDDNLKVCRAPFFYAVAS